MDLKRYSYYSDKGPLLNSNEDLCFMNLEQMLFFVLDGIGGSGIGDKASELVSREVSEHYLRLSDDPDATMSFFYNPLYNLELNSLMNSLHSAHNSLFRKNHEVHKHSQGAVSGVFVSQAESSLNTVSVGAGSVYLFRENELFSIYKNNLCLADFSKNLKGRSIPSSPLGLYKDISFYIKEIKIEPGDLFLLFSDGAVDSLSLDELQGLIINSNFEQLAQIICEMSNKKDNKDNQSVILLQY